MYLVFRQLNSISNVECFFTDGDNWGQYGPHRDDRNKLDEFVLNYIEITVQILL